MKLKVVTKTMVAKVNFVTIEGHEYEFDRVAEALDCLEEADCLFTSCIIEEGELGDDLARLGVAFKCTRGGYRKSYNYVEFCRDLVKALAEATEE